MKKDDFERLKAVCEKEGFEISIANRSLKDVFEIHKKDPWEGVEFAECVKNLLCAFTEGKIYRILTEINQEECFIDDEGDINGLGLENKEYFKPSTESAYVEQLKKEAFERFGEIRHGDLFDRSALLDFKDTKSIGDCYGFEGFRYYKENDGLDFNGTCIYKQGNWATRVKELVKVDHVGVDYSTWSGNVFFGFSFKGSQDIDKSGIGSFLASQLEKYLNGEIE